MCIIFILFLFYCALFLFPFVDFLLIIIIVKNMLFLHHHGKMCSERKKGITVTNCSSSQNRWLGFIFLSLSKKSYCCFSFFIFSLLCCFFFCIPIITHTKKQIFFLCHCVCVSASFRIKQLLKFLKLEQRKCNDCDIQYLTWSGYRKNNNELKIEKVSFSFFLFPPILYLCILLLFLYRVLFLYL